LGNDLQKTSAVRNSIAINAEMRLAGGKFFGCVQSSAHLRSIIICDENNGALKLELSCGLLRAPKFIAFLSPFGSSSSSVLLWGWSWPGAK
jgi:hypothetical protein